MSNTEALGIHPPKLPELHAEEIKSVRSFLPGKLLGCMSALLALVVLEYFGLLQHVKC